MKKSRNKNQAPARQAVAERVRRRDRRLLIRGGIALAVAVPLAAAGIYQYERIASRRHDLSAIGNGQPTVVQVMDHGCVECRELRSRLSGVRKEFEPRVQFRVADRTTTDGALFASRHNAGHLTLLMFGADGELRNTLTGMQDAETIRTAIASTFPASRSR